MCNDLGLSSADSSDEYTYWTQTTRTKLAYFFVDNDLIEHINSVTFDAGIGPDHVPGICDINIHNLHTVE